MSNNSTNTPYYLGIDGGGTKCKAVITDAQGTVLGTGLSGPANPLRGLDQTIDSIVTASHLALEYAKINKNMIGQLVAGIGLAGVNIPRYMSKMQQWQHPFKSAFFTTDMHIACLGAHNGNDGAIIITGTGSAGFAEVNNQAYIFGGHGFLLGDKASGAWIGLTALQHILEAHDGIAPQSQLNQLICHQLGCHQIIDVLDTLSVAKPAFFAKLAPCVFLAASNGDEVACSIIKQAANYVDKLAARLLSTNAPRLALIGGISTPLTAWLNSETQQKICPVQLEPELGAIKFAQQMNNTNDSCNSLSK